MSIQEALLGVLGREAPDVRARIYDTLTTNEVMFSLHFEADRNFRLAEEVLVAHQPPVEAISTMLQQALDQMRRDAIVGLGMQDWERRVREEERRKATRAAVTLLRTIAEEGVRYATTTDRAALNVYDQARLVERDGLIRD